MRTKQTISLACGLWLLALGGCGGPLFKVSPIPKNPPAELTTSAAPNGLEVGASRLDDDRALNQFGANLSLAGLIGVEVRLANRTTEPIEVGALRFELRDQAGKTYKPLEPKKALKRLMKYYGKRIYFKEAYRQTKELFESIAIPAAAPLAPQEERGGFIFFETKGDAAAVSALILLVEGGRPRIELQLK